MYVEIDSHSHYTSAESESLNVFRVRKEERRRAFVSSSHFFSSSLFFSSRFSSLAHVSSPRYPSILLLSLFFSYSLVLSFSALEN
jgi:hypothetical protein